MDPVEVAVISDAISRIRAVLLDHVFRVTSEAMLQDQVAHVLARVPDVWIDREVGVPGGRCDIVLEVDSTAIALELKLNAPVAAVERQAQRYAKISEIDAVVVVTTSSQLGAKLADLRTLGGKPFSVITLRTT